MKEQGSLRPLQEGEVTQGFAICAAIGESDTENSGSRLRVERPGGLDFTTRSATRDRLIVATQVCQHPARQRQLSTVGITRSAPQDRWTCSPRHSRIYSSTTAKISSLELRSVRSCNRS